MKNFSSGIKQLEHVVHYLPDHRPPLAVEDERIAGALISLILTGAQENSPGNNSLLRLRKSRCRRCRLRRSHRSGSHRLAGMSEAAWAAASTTSAARADCEAQCGEEGAWEAVLGEGCSSRSTIRRCRTTRTIRFRGQSQYNLHQTTRECCERFISQLTVQRLCVSKNIPGSSRTPRRDRPRHRRRRSRRACRKPSREPAGA